MVLLPYTKQRNGSASHGTPVQSQGTAIQGSRMVSQLFTKPWNHSTALYRHSAAGRTILRLCSRQQKYSTALYRCSVYVCIHIYIQFSHSVIWHLGSPIKNMSWVFCQLQFVTSNSSWENLLSLFKIKQMLTKEHMNWTFKWVYRLQVNNFIWKKALSRDSS